MTNPLNLPWTCIRRNVGLIEPFNLIHLITWANITANRHAKKVEHEVRPSWNAVDPEQAVYAYDQAYLLSHFAYYGVPRRLSHLDPSPWEVPHIPIRSVAQQYPGFRIHDNCERTNSMRIHINAAGFLGNVRPLIYVHMRPVHRDA
jgi:hypothetical protein